jgi:hypothetical protein
MMMMIHSFVGDTKVTMMGVVMKPKEDEFGVDQGLCRKKPNGWDDVFESYSGLILLQSHSLSQFRIFYALPTDNRMFGFWKLRYFSLVLHHPPIFSFFWWHLSSIKYCTW